MKDSRHSECSNSKYIILTFWEDVRAGKNSDFFMFGALPRKAADIYGRKSLRAHRGSNPFIFHLAPVLVVTDSISSGAAVQQQRIPLHGFLPRPEGCGPLRRGRQLTTLRLDPALRSI